MCFAVYECSKFTLRLYIGIVHYNSHHSRCSAAGLSETKHHCWPVAGASPLVTDWLQHSGGPFGKFLDTRESSVLLCPFRELWPRWNWYLKPSRHHSWISTLTSPRNYSTTLIFSHSGVFLATLSYAEFALKFRTVKRTVINGKANDLSLSEFSGGAHILFVFHELFNVILYRYCIVNICHYWIRVVWMKTSKWRAENKAENHPENLFRVVIWDWFSANSRCWFSS